MASNLLEILSQLHDHHVLWSLGARPRIPEGLDRIRDVEQVRRWRQDKGMLALNFRSPDGALVFRDRRCIRPLDSDQSTSGNEKSSQVLAWTR